MPYDPYGKEAGMVDGTFFRGATPNHTFGPAVLRMLGIDPNSPQGQALVTQNQVGPPQTDYNLNGQLTPSYPTPGSGAGFGPLPPGGPNMGSSGGIAGGGMLGAGQAGGPANPNMQGLAGLARALQESMRGSGDLGAFDRANTGPIGSSDYIPSANVRQMFPGIGGGGSGYGPLQIDPGPGPGAMLGYGPEDYPTAPPVTTKPFRMPRSTMPYPAGGVDQTNLNDIYGSGNASGMGQYGLLSLAMGNRPRFASAFRSRRPRGFQGY